MKGSLLDEVKVDENGKHYLPMQQYPETSRQGYDTTSALKRSSITEFVQHSTRKLADMISTVKSPRLDSQQQTKKDQPIADHPPASDEEFKTSPSDPSADF